MRNAHLFFLLLAPAMAMAMECDEKFICTGNGVSKNDIKELSERLNNHSFNGKSFSLEAVQKIFKNGASLENPAPKDYGTYWEKRNQFTSDYGNTAEAEILFNLAKADFYIKKYEKEHGLKIADGDQVVTDYIFLGTGRMGHPEVAMGSDCFMDVKFGKKTDTECKNYPDNSSRLPGAVLYLATLGILGEIKPKPATLCVTEKPVHALVRSKVGDKEVIYATTFMATGGATDYDDNILGYGIKVASRKQCEQDALEIEDRTVLYSCNTHQPLDKAASTEFNRSPAVVEQFGKKLKELQHQQ